MLCFVTMAGACSGFYAYWGRCVRIKKTARVNVTYICCACTGRVFVSVDPCYADNFDFPLYLHMYSASAYIHVFV